MRECWIIKHRVPKPLSWCTATAASFHRPLPIFLLSLIAGICEQELPVTRSLSDAQQKKTHPRLCHFVPLNYNDFADFPQYFCSESLTTAAELLRHRVNKHFSSQSAALLQRICHCPLNHNLTSRASKLCPTHVLVWFQSAGADKLNKWSWFLSKGSGLLTAPPCPSTPVQEANMPSARCQPNVLPSWLLCHFQALVPDWPTNNRNNTCGGTAAMWGNTQPPNEKMIRSPLALPSTSTNGLKITLHTQSTHV